MARTSLSIHIRGEQLLDMFLEAADDQIIVRYDWVELAWSQQCEQLRIR
jgi:hypothetical protein